MILVPAFVAGRNQRGDGAISMSVGTVLAMPIVTFVQPAVGATWLALAATVVIASAVSLQGNPDARRATVWIAIRISVLALVLYVPLDRLWLRAFDCQRQLVRANAVKDTIFEAREHDLRTPGDPAMNGVRDRRLRCLGELWSAGWLDQVHVKEVDEEPREVVPERLMGRARVPWHRDFTPDNGLLDGDRREGVLDVEHARGDRAEANVTRLMNDGCTTDLSRWNAFRMGDQTAEGPWDLPGNGVAEIALLEALTTLAWAVRHGDDVRERSARTVLGVRHGIPLGAGEARSRAGMYMPT